MDLDGVYTKLFTPLLNIYQKRDLRHNHNYYLSLWMLWILLVLMIVQLFKVTKHLENETFAATSWHQRQNVLVFNASLYSILLTWFEVGITKELLEARLYTSLGKLLFRLQLWLNLVFTIYRAFFTKTKSSKLLNHGLGEVNGLGLCI